MCLREHKSLLSQVSCGSRICSGSGPNKRLAKRAAAEAMLAEIGYVKPLPPPGKSLLKKKMDSQLNIGMWKLFIVLYVSNWAFTAAFKAFSTRMIWFRRQLRVLETSPRQIHRISTILTARRSTLFKRDYCKPRLSQYTVYRRSCYSLWTFGHANCFQRALHWRAQWTASARRCVVVVFKRWRRGCIECATVSRSPARDIQQSSKGVPSTRFVESRERVLEFGCCSKHGALDDSKYPEPELAPLKADVLVEGRVKRIRRTKEAKRWERTYRGFNVHILFCKKREVTML